jgi:iron complex outermembrane receptor protein
VKNKYLAKATRNCAISITLISLTPAVQAQSLEEITVTAQRRAETLQSIPLAVSAFSAEDLGRLGATEALDIAKVIPNFVAHNNTGLGTANLYSIRGLNNTESIATFDPPVGTYIGDFFIQRQSANNYALFDVERMEVLRGPQGTLFGRNTTGGAVRMIMKEPAAERGGYIELGTGSFDRVQLRGGIDLPVSDTFRTKFAAYYIEDDGFVDNVTTGETGLNSEENTGIRASAQWDISDATTWDASVSWINTDHANMYNFVGTDGDRYTQTGLVENGAPLAEGFFTTGITGPKQDFPLGNETESLHFTSDISWELGNSELSFLASYLTLEQEFLLDFFEGPFTAGGFTIANDSQHDQTTLELKLSGSLADDKLDYVAGVFYFDEDNETDFTQIFNLALVGVPAPPPEGFPLIQYDRTMDNTATSFAAYVQGDWHISDRFTLTAGVRFTDEEKTFGLRDNGNPAAAAIINTADLVAAGVPIKQTESITTPRIALEFQMSDDVMWYGSATKGFKAGGWNARGTTADQLVPFDPEFVWTYEAGLRSELLDNKLRVNLTVFQTDVEDFQVPSAFTDPSSGAIVFITRNFADLDVSGAEIELFAVPTDNLTLFANIGLMDSEYTNLNSAITDQQAECRTMDTRCSQGIVNPVGDIAPPTRAPESQVSVGGWYTFQIGSNYELTPKVTAVQYGNHNISTSGQDVALIDDYTVVNGGISLENMDNDWSLTLACKNCTDEDQKVSFLAGFIYLQDPSTWSLTFNKQF